MPSRDFTSEDLFSSRMISMHSSTHSSQMNTVGPAISLRTSCWLLPQNEQYSVFFESLVPTLLILVSSRRSISSARSPHSGTCRQYYLDRAKSVPEKTPFSKVPPESRLTRIPDTLPNLTQRTMVPPDYQEFANWQRARCRDNSVICRACATQAIG